MPADQPLVVEPALLGALAVGVVGVLAVWANPHRKINKLFFSASVHVGLWLLCLYCALSASNGLVWVRATCAVGALIPVHLWVLKEAVTGSQLFERRFFQRSTLWTAACIVMVCLAYSSWFVPAHSTAQRPVYGWGYYAYMAIHLGVYCALSRDTFLKMRAQSGITRLELQLLLLGGSSTAIAILVLMAASVIWRTRLPIHLQPLVVLVFYAATVMAMTTHRVFDARQLVIVGLRRGVLVFASAGAAFGADTVFQFILPEPFAFIVTTGAVLFLASELSAWLDSILGQYPKAVHARAAVFAAAKREKRFDPLIAEFDHILRGWAQSERASILVRAEKGFSGGSFSLEISEQAVDTIKERRWVTPERLVREKGWSEKKELQRILDENHLGALVSLRGPTLDLVAAVGVRPSRRPFTFPEVVQLQELLSIIEGSLARTHLSAKAQRAEQLATVGLLGAGVAHEIRNPLVTIKAFVQLLPQHYNDENFRNRFSTLIGEEVGRIDRLTEQLLDLASPKTYKRHVLSLHDVYKASLELIATRAAEKSVVIIDGLNACPDLVFTDANASKQVLMNLCFNAIQAQEHQSAPRWVKVESRNLGSSIELTVSDNGPGIAPEIRSRLFEAFQTTKSTGFGLGLAICSEILSSLDASISVDPYAPGKGATFRVVFPCPPRTS